MFNLWQVYVIINVCHAIFFLFLIMCNQSVLGAHSRRQSCILKVIAEIPYVINYLIGDKVAYFGGFQLCDGITFQTDQLK